MEEKMKKQHFDMINTSSNQQLLRSYESGIEGYLNDKEDNFWTPDDFYPAEKDDRIAGEREAMEARRLLSQGLSFANFSDFKRKALTEWREELNQENNPKQKEIISDKISQLEQSDSYKNFGTLVGNYIPVQRYINISNASENKKQVNKNLTLIEPLIDARYNMMQSVATAVSDKQDLFIPDSKYSRLYQKIEDGFHTVKRKKDDGWYFRQYQRDAHVDRLSFNNVRKYAFQAKGYAQAYEDALQALVQSNQWHIICAFQAEKAKKNGDRIGESAWEKGDVGGILSYLRSSGQLNTKIDITALYQGVDNKNLHNVVIPSLERLKAAEMQYGLFAKFANETNRYLKQNPMEIDRLENLIPQNESLVLLDNTFLARENETFLNTFKSFSDRMVQKDSVGEGIYNVAEYGVIIAGSAAVVTLTGGTGLVAVGVGMGSACVIGGGLELAYAQSETLSSWRKDAQNWLSDTWVSNAFLELKNSHVVKEVQQTVNYQTELANSAMKRSQKISEDDYDKALAYALQNTSFSNAAVIEQVIQARRFAALPKNERDEFIQKHNKEMQDLIGKMGSNQDVDLSTKTRLENESMMIEAAQSGQYFYTIQAGMDMRKRLSESKQEHLKLYRGKEAELLRALSFSYQNRVASEMEANYRENLVIAWRQAGSPVVQIDQKGLSDENDNDFYDPYNFSVNFKDEKNEGDLIPVSVKSETEQVNKKEKDVTSSPTTDSEEETSGEEVDIFYDFQVDFGETEQVNKKEKDVTPSPTTDSEEETSGEEVDIFYDFQVDFGETEEKTDEILSREQYTDLQQTLSGVSIQLPEYPKNSTRIKKTQKEVNYG